MTKQCKIVVLDNIRSQKGIHFQTKLVRPSGRPASAAGAASSTVPPAAPTSFADQMTAVQERFGQKFNDSHFIMLLLSFGFNVLRDRASKQQSKQEVVKKVRNAKKSRDAPESEEKEDAPPRKHQRRDSVNSVPRDREVAQAQATSKRPKQEAVKARKVRKARDALESEEADEKEDTPPRKQQRRDSGDEMDTSD